MKIKGMTPLAWPLPPYRPLSSPASPLAAPVSGPPSDERIRAALADPAPELRTVLPELADWVSRTIAEHAGRARAIAGAGFLRLPRCFPGPTGEQLLATAHFVVVDRLPMPPLSSWGLERFRSFEEAPVNAITYESTYFVTPDAASDESAHLHELVHVIQWRTLGLENFAVSYAVGLDLCGYADSPLEALAFHHQDRFRRGEDYDVGRATLAQIGFLYGRKT
jgi:hypothetical protein